jgi:hypothetical protein
MPGAVWLNGSLAHDCRQDRLRFLAKGGMCCLWRTLSTQVRVHNHISIVLAMVKVMMAKT